jgi:hypothetical protein
MHHEELAAAVRGLLGDGKPGINGKSNFPNIDTRALYLKSVECLVVVPRYLEFVVQKGNEVAKGDRRSLHRSPEIVCGRKARIPAASRSLPSNHKFIPWNRGNCLT